jgi:hypothetical protein
MKNYIGQYKLMFFVSWIGLYFIFPSWINLHAKLHTWGFPVNNNQLARTIAILLLTGYFSVSSYLVNRYFDCLRVDKPLFIRINNWSGHIKGNLWLVIFCVLSVVLHIYTLSLVQVSYLTQGLWMYDFSSKYLSRLFDIPIQYFFWSFMVLLILMIRNKKLISVISNFLSEKSSILKSKNSSKVLFIFFIFSFFSLYSYLFPYYSWEESLVLLRFPPVSHYLYLISYYAFGVSHVGPKIVQLMFYVLGAVYLYRTIYLFREKETALLGATIYLFSPIIFHYASVTALESGVVFFIILISYYFLRFIKIQDNRDLILASYFIGLGFLYKQVVLVMLVICFAYLVLSIIKKRDWNSINHCKILLLSLIPILPWLKFATISVYYDVYFDTTVSQLISFDSLTAYAAVLHAQLSPIILILFLCSIIFIFFAKRDDLSMFFGLSFVAYYLFFTKNMPGFPLHRYSTAFYPAISVLLAQFVHSICHKFRWKYTYKIVFSALTFYLIILCVIPRSSSDLITFKYRDFETQYYPSEEATDWVRNRTKDDEKILTLMMSNHKFYVERIYADKDGINYKRFIRNFNLNIIEGSIDPLQKIKEFCHENDISYIMFQFGPKNYYYPNSKEISEKLNKLKESMDNELIQAAQFNIDDNYIIIYKLTE